MPVMERFGVAATARASFALYNDRSDVDRLMAGLETRRGAVPWMSCKSCIAK